MMKTYIQQLWTISLFIVAVLVGCTKTDYPVFDTGQKAALYSDREKDGVDTLKFESKITNEMIDQYYNFTVVGIPVAYDREIAVEILETNLSENQYGIRNHVIKANEVVGSVILEFYNDESLKDSTVYLYFRIVDNEHFNVLQEMTPEFYVVNEVKDQAEPKWWDEKILGPFSPGLHKKMISTFTSLEEINPNLHTVLGDELGYRLEKEPTRYVNIGSPYRPNYVYLYSGEMWKKYKQPMMKYVVIPLYEYYQEHPEDGVNIPEPILLQ